MSRMKELAMDIEQMIELGHGFETIARTLDIPVQWVIEVADSMVDDAYDDSMDGDAASALASAGFGTDEDYGCFGDE